jgi:hypothetical protein
MNKMKTTVIYTLFLLFTFQLNAQEFDIIFQQCYGGAVWEGAWSIIPKNGGIIAFCSTSSNDGDVSFNHGKNDYWLIKTNDIGEIVWEKTYGGSEEDYPAHMLPSPDGGYVMFGHTYSTNGDVSCNHGDGDWWLVKTDSLGNIQWSHCYGGTHKETASQLIYAHEGGYVMTGKTGSVDGDISHNNGMFDVWVVKVDWEGEILWERTFGGSSNDWGNSIAPTADGGYIVGGGASSHDGNVYCPDAVASEWSTAWVIKLDGEGQIEWQNCYGGTESDIVADIIQTQDSGFIFLGAISSGDGDVDCFHGTPGDGSTNDMWVVKLDETGEIEWHRCLGGTGFDSPKLIRQMQDGGYLVGGNTTSRDGTVVCNESLPGTHTVILYKLSPEGETEWTKCLGSQVDNSLLSMHMFSDYHFLLGATTRTWGMDVDCDLKGETDIWIVEIQDTTVGMHEERLLQWQLFPNPATTQSWLQLPENTTLAQAQIELYSPAGKLLHKAKPSSHFLKIDVAHLPKGLYLVRLWDGERWYVEKLVVW